MVKRNDYQLSVYIRNRQLHTDFLEYITDRGWNCSDLFTWFEYIVMTGQYVLPEIRRINYVSKNNG